MEAHIKDRKRAITAMERKEFDLLSLKSQSVYQQIEAIDDLNDELMREVVDLTDLIVDNCNSVHTKSMRDDYLDILNRWRYYLNNKGVYLRNHVVHIRDDFFDASDNSRSDESWAKSSISHRVGKKVIFGRAHKDAKDKTVPIVTERIVKDSKTGKFMRKTRKFLIHDEFNEVSEGDIVTAIETRPISKRKNFSLFSVKKDI